MLYTGKFVMQYRKSANAKLRITILVCLKGTRSNPNILFFCAQGMARSVNRFPTPPNMAKKMHLKIQYKMKKA